MSEHQYLERSVLSAVLARPEVLLDISNVFEVGDFQVDAHRVIWRVLEDAINNGLTPEMTAVIGALEDAHLLDDAGGASYVSGLFDELPDPGNAVHYAQRVREMSLRRRVQLMLVELSGKVESELSSSEVLDLLMHRAVELGAGVGDTHESDMGDEAVAEIARIKDGGAQSSVNLGLPKIDFAIGGVTPGQLVVIGARTSVGKTALALGIGIHAATSGKRVAIVSLEMSRQELARRALAWVSGVKLGRITYGRLAGDGSGEAYWQDTWRRVDEAGETLRRARMRVVDGAAVTPVQLRQRARRWQLRGGLDLLIVDYLQLMRSGLKTSGRTEEVSEISRGLKLLALDLGIPIIACSQLNREPAKRDDARAVTGTERTRGEPRLSDLRECGSIENDADVVLLLHRQVEGSDEEIGRALAILAKHRNGPTGRFALSFTPATYRFWEA